MSIKFFNDDVPFPKIRRKIISDWIKKVIGLEGKSCGDITIIFCSDEYLLNVNRQYLNHDYYTDIITFDYVEKQLISGDIFISVDRIAENAEIYNSGFKIELHRIVVHGVLHLLGYKDKSKKDKLLMTEKEDTYLKLLEIS